MSTINTDLIAHIYAASESPLTNDELYREVQRKTGMSDAELHELKNLGQIKPEPAASNIRFAGFSRLSVRPGSSNAFQKNGASGDTPLRRKQTCMSHGKSSVLSVSQLLLGHRFWKRLCLLQQYHRANSSLPDLATLPPSKFKRLRARRGAWRAGLY